MAPAAEDNVAPVAANFILTQKIYQKTVFVLAKKIYVKMNQLVLKAAQVFKFTAKSKNVSLSLRAFTCEIY